MKKKYIDYDKIIALMDKKFAEEITKFGYSSYEEADNRTKLICDGMSKIYELIMFNLPTVDMVEVVRCKDCKHRPVKNEDYDDDQWDRGYNIKFPDYKCPCQCEDGYYNKFPDDDWFCPNGERKPDETD